MNNNDLTHAAEAALPTATCSARFHYYSESGFVYDYMQAEWLTNAEEVFEAMQWEIERYQNLTAGLKAAACALPLDSEGYRLAVAALDRFDTQPNAKVRNAGPDAPAPATNPTPAFSPPPCSALDFRDGDLAAIRFRDNWDGQGDICECIAVWRGGEWWPNEGGNRLLYYVGSEILHIWPMRL